jgi:hypothetical protein
MVGWLVFRTTFSGHLCADLIRMAALSMISGRSGKLGGSSGKIQLAINRRTASALPTTIKYLAIGTTSRAPTSAFLSSSRKTPIQSRREQSMPPCSPSTRGSPACPPRR